MKSCFLFLHLPILLPMLWVGPDYPEDLVNLPPKTAIESPVNTDLEPYNPAMTDLEEKEQDFILGAKKIEIPGHPHAFNPSIVRWKGALLLSFRVYNPQTGFPNQIGLIWLDEEFNLVGRPQILQSRIDDPLSLYKRQDPRLIVIGERLFIVYNNQLRTIVDREIRRMFVAEVFQNGEGFYTDAALHLTHFEGENATRTQKNWVPFEYQRELLLSYSITPHRVVRPSFDRMECETFSNSDKATPWQWGILRGGTPALLVGDRYLAFFHSSINLPSLHSGGRVVLHYFMGAYTFSPHPPFCLEKISPAPIIGKHFYKGPNYRTWKPLRVVFPGGFVFDEEHIWVVYGRQDHEVWVVKLDRKKLFDSLIPVERV